VLSRGRRYLARSWHSLVQSRFICSGIPRKLVEFEAGRSHYSWAVMAAFSLAAQSLWPVACALGWQFASVLATIPSRSANRLALSKHTPTEQIAEPERLRFRQFHNGDSRKVLEVSSSRALAVDGACEVVG
jgi:hypothetical protein